MKSKNDLPARLGVLIKDQERLLKLMYGKKGKFERESRTIPSLRGSDGKRR